MGNQKYKHVEKYIIQYNGNVNDMYRKSCVQLLCPSSLETTLSFLPEIL